MLTTPASAAIADTTWVQSIPMPVPHTRPISLTVSGTRADLVEQMSVWKPETQAPANVLHLVEHRLSELGQQVTGLVLLVPHYLSDTEFPDAAVAAFSGPAAPGGGAPVTGPAAPGREAPDAGTGPQTFEIEVFDTDYDAPAAVRAGRVAVADETDGADGAARSAEASAAGPGVPRG